VSEDREPEEGTKPPPATSRDEPAGDDNERPGATRRDAPEPSSDGTPAPTSRDVDPGEGVASLIRLPSAVAADYEVVEDFAASGAEADLVLVRERASGERFIVKIYRRGIELDQDTGERLSRADTDHVVGIVRVGRSDGRWYEVLEYIEAGTLARLLQVEGPVLATELLAEIVQELAPALAHLHSLGVIHRDIKPANVLVRTREPLDLVLADFGLAMVSEESVRFASSSRTFAYAAPESLAGMVSPARDYWSLGIVVVEALRGQHPFAGLSDQVINAQLTSRPVDVSDIEDERWALLARGLLVRDPELRWGAQELEQWCNGENPPVAADQGSFRTAEGAQRPYRLGGDEFWTPADLGVGLANNWDDARKDLARGYVQRWLHEDVGDHELARKVSDIEEEKNLDLDLKVLRVVLTLDPEIEPTFKGYRVDGEGLLALAAAAQKNPKGEEGKVLHLVFKERALTRYDRRPELAELDAVWREEDQAFTGITTGTDAAGATKIEGDLREVVRAQLLRLLRDGHYLEQLRTEVHELATDDARETPWFRSIGDVADARPASLVALHLFAGEAQTATLTRREEAAERARQEAEELRQRRAAATLRMRSVAGWMIPIAAIAGAVAAIGPGVVAAHLSLRADVSGELDGAAAWSWILAATGVGLLVGLLLQFGPRHRTGEGPLTGVQTRHAAADAAVGGAIGVALIHVVLFLLNEEHAAEVFGVSARLELNDYDPDDWWFQRVSDFQRYLTENPGAARGWSIFLLVVAVGALTIHACVPFDGAQISWGRWVALTAAVLVLTPYTLLYLGYVLAVVGVILIAVIVCLIVLAVSNW